MDIILTGLTEAEVAALAGAVSYLPALALASDPRLTDDERGRNGALCLVALPGFSQNLIDVITPEELRDLAHKVTDQVTTRPLPDLASAMRSINRVRNGGDVDFTA